jgi:hypothetical protein
MPFRVGIERLFLIESSRWKSTWLCSSRSHTTKLDGTPQGKLHFSSVYVMLFLGPKNRGINSVTIGDIMKWTVLFVLAFAALQASETNSPTVTNKGSTNITEHVVKTNAPPFVPKRNLAIETESKISLSSYSWFDNDSPPLRMRHDVSLSREASVHGFNIFSISTK